MDELRRKHERAGMKLEDIFLDMVAEGDGAERERVC